MYSYVDWEDAAEIDDSYADVLECEALGHNLLIDKNGTLRWEEDRIRYQEIMDEFGASDLNDLFGRCRADKNTQIIRELYKCNGYSLSGFWEIFYWDWNNDRVDEFVCRNCNVP